MIANIATLLGVYLLGCTAACLFGAMAHFGAHDLDE